MITTYMFSLLKVRTDDSSQRIVQMKIIHLWWHKEETPWDWSSWTRTFVTCSFRNIRSVLRRILGPRMWFTLMKKERYISMPTQCSLIVMWCHCWPVHTASTLSSMTTNSGTASVSSLQTMTDGSNQESTASSPKACSLSCMITDNKRFSSGKRYRSCSTNRHKMKSTITGFMRCSSLRSHQMFTEEELMESMHRTTTGVLLIHHQSNGQEYLSTDATSTSKSQKIQESNYMGSKWSSSEMSIQGYQTAWCHTSTRIMR